MASKKKSKVRNAKKPGKKKPARVAAKKTSKKGSRAEGKCSNCGKLGVNSRTCPHKEK